MDALDNIPCVFPHIVLNPHRPFVGVRELCNTEWNSSVLILPGGYIFYFLLFPFNIVQICLYNDRTNALLGQASSKQTGYDEKDKNEKKSSYKRFLFIGPLLITKHIAAFTIWCPGLSRGLDRVIWKDYLVWQRGLNWRFFARVKPPYSGVLFERLSHIFHPQWAFTFKGVVNLFANQIRSISGPCKYEYPHISISFNLFPRTVVPPSVVVIDTYKCCRIWALFVLPKFRDINNNSQANNAFKNETFEKGNHPLFIPIQPTNPRCHREVIWDVFPGASRYPLQIY